MKLQVKNSVNTSDRKIHMDVLRIIAIYFVVFNHTGTKGFTLFTVSQTSNFYSGYLFISIVTKIAVPLFWMISGALLLKKDESIRTVLTKRVARFAVVLFVFSAFQYLDSLNYSFSDFSLSEYIEKLYSGPLASAYWYLYAYLGYLLMLPLLRRLTAVMKNKDFLYLIALRFLIAFLPIIEFVIWKGKVEYSANFALQLTADVIFYPIIGYYAEHCIPESYLSKKNLVFLSFISIAVISVCCILTHYNCTVTDDWSNGNNQLFHNVLTFIPVISLYLAAKQFFAGINISDRVTKIIAVLSGTTFGIMLIENIIRYGTSELCNILTPYIGRMPACLVWIGIVCCICSLIILIIKQIPFVKKLI